MKTNQKKQWINPEILDLDILMTRGNNPGPYEDGAYGTVEEPS